MSESQMEHQGVTYTVFSCDKCTTGEVFYTINKLLEHTTAKHSLAQSKVDVKSIQEASQEAFKPSIPSRNGTNNDAR